MARVVSQVSVLQRSPLSAKPLPVQARCLSSGLRLCLSLHPVCNHLQARFPLDRELSIPRA